MLASSDEQAEALDFVRFLLSESRSSTSPTSSKEYPLVAGVEPDPTLVPLGRDPVPARLDLSSLSDVQATIELMQETGAL